MGIPEYDVLGGYDAMMIQRHILPILEQTVEEYSVTLVTGARQVGKTTLVSLFRQRGYSYVTFDDTDLLEEAKSRPKKFVEEHPAPIIIDEAQRAVEIFPEIEAAVNKAKLEKGSAASNGMYILTGSQKFVLMQGVSESMSGRVGIVEMPPLSQAEIRGWGSSAFLVDNEVMFAKSDSRSLSDNDLYLSIVRGFYPARWEIEGKPIRNYFANYLKTYLERDVSKLVNIRDLSKFENLLRVLASLTGEEFVADNVAKTVGVDKNTVSSWTGILQASGIVTLLPPYYEESMNKRIVKRKKIYFNDTGFACYLIGIDTPKTLRLSAFRGRLVETYIHNEIRKSYVNFGLDDRNMFYYRDNNQNEIDLILLRDGALERIECKSGKSFTSKDIKGFAQVSQTSFELGGSCIICLCEEPYRIAPNTFAFPIRCI